MYYFCLQFNSEYCFMYRLKRIIKVMDCMIFIFYISIDISSSIFITCSCV